MRISKSNSSFSVSILIVFIGFYIYRESSSWYLDLKNLEDLDEPGRVSQFKTSLLDLNI